jgi:excinuclease UvrABC nuclease subunit
VAGSAREQAALLALAPGVYRFRGGAGKVLYLGRATTLRRRATSYWGDLGGRAQRHCGEAAARPHVAATPREWREFAQRNATLAARLAT